MSLIAWFLFFLFVQIIHFVCTWKLYIAAGRKAWEAAIPIYNALILMRIIHRPMWWTILLFLPIINLVMSPVIWIETLRSSRKNTAKHTSPGTIRLRSYIRYFKYSADLD